jgi:hypothetical protein
MEWAMTGKFARLAVLLVGLGSSLPAAADELRADDARRFIAGKMFAYNCFEGTSGAGRIYSDGSVVGYIQVRGSAPRYVALPAGTLRITGERYCAQVRGMPFQPCFHVERTSAVSWRGSISGLSCAYCDFHRRGARAEVARGPTRIGPTQSASAAPSGE